MVTDAAGNPLPELNGHALCGGICQVGDDRRDQGAFRFEGVWPVANVLESVGYPGERSRPRTCSTGPGSSTSISLAEGEHVVLDRPMRMHPVTPARGLSRAPRTSRSSPGLRVVFDADRIGVDHVLPHPRRGGRPRCAVELPARGLAARGRRLDPGQGLGLRRCGTSRSTTAFRPPPPSPSPLPTRATRWPSWSPTTWWASADGVLAARSPPSSTPDGLTVRTPAGGGIDRTTLWVLATRPR